jgi:hypothetical protein
MTRLSTRCGGRRPKSANARSRGKYGTRQSSECYGDRMLVAISMVDAARAHIQANLVCAIRQDNFVIALCGVDVTRRIRVAGLPDDPCCS